MQASVLFVPYIHLRIGRACTIAESCYCFNFKAKVRPTTVIQTMKSLGYVPLIIIIATKYIISITRALSTYTGCNNTVTEIIDKRNNINNYYIILYSNRYF